ncbi:MAG: hypothetical protein RR881_02085, partial [Malacoplasma sp.]
WNELTLSDVLEQINLQRDSVDPSRQINLQSLANIGIVPNNENWKSWVWVRAQPIEGRSNSFRISILETIASEGAFSYDISVANGAIKGTSYYNAANKLAGNANFYAYTPTTLTTLSDYYLNYQKTSSNPLTTISIRNLEVIGIVPIYDQYKSWESITLFPIDGKTIQVSINTGATTNPIIRYNITDITTSTFYNASSATIASNANFVAYTPKSFSQTALINLNIELTKNANNPSSQITFANLEKLGIVPLTNDYKLWESISIYPIEANKVKCTIQTSTTATPISYDITGVKPSTYYDTTAPIYTGNNDFIMYTPYEWKRLFPVQALLMLTSTSAIPETKISLQTLEKIGIVPKNLEYKKWTNITVTPQESGTCLVTIKRDRNIVAEFKAACFKTSGKYDTNSILYTGTTTPFKFIWYKPTAWNNILPTEITVNFTSSNITLESLENIGIVPLNNEYKTWSSILKSDILYGLQGKFSVAMTSSSSPSTPLNFDITGLKQSTIYDSSMIIRQYPNSNNPDFIQFQPNAFKRPTSAYLDTLRLLVWVNQEISKPNLEKIGIVPINDTYLGWSKVEFGFKHENSNEIVFKIYNNRNNANDYIEVTYPFTIVIG